MKRLITVAVTAALMPFAAAAGNHDDDEGRGIRFGSFVARPSATVSAGYNSNLFRDENNKTDSFISISNLRAQVESDWNRNALRLDTGLEFGYLANSTDDNYLDAFSALTGVLDVKRNARIIGSVGYAREHDARGSDDADTGAEAEPIKYDVWSASLRGEVGFGRFRVDPFVGIEYLNFLKSDAIGGGNLDHNDRDRLEGGAGVELGYAVRRGYEAFVRTSYLWTDYDENGGPNDRSSNGFQVLGGFKVDLTRLITGSVGVGYEEVNYDGANQKDFSGFSMDAGLDWSITRRTTLTAAASRSPDETSVAGASNYVDTGGSIGVSHELRRNLSINGSASYFDRDFTGIGRNDDLITTRIGANWQINRRFSLSPEYRFGTRNSNTSNDYNVHEIRLSGTVRF